MSPRIGPKKPFRHFLREWREHRHLSQQQLADRIEVHKGQISNYENGKRQMSAAAQAALCDALSIDLSDLFRDPNQPSADALLRNASPELRAQAIALVETLLKTASR